MQVILDKLNHVEMNFLLRLLNSANATVAILNERGFQRRESALSANEAIALDRIGDKLRKHYEQGKVNHAVRRATGERNLWFAQSFKDRAVNRMRGEWG